MMTFLLRLAHPLRQFYWRIVRPETRGVRAIVENNAGEILLVQHTYQDGWFLPGGKVRARETDEAALRRELQEELGLQVDSIAEKLGEYVNTYEYKKDTIAVFIVRSLTMQNVKRFEVEQWAFFHPAMLPPSTSPGTRRRIAEHCGERSITAQW